MDEIAKRANCEDAERPMWLPEHCVCPVDVPADTKDHKDDPDSTNIGTGAMGVDLVSQSEQPDRLSNKGRYWAARAGFFAAAQRFRFRLSEVLRGLRSERRCRELWGEHGRTRKPVMVSEGPLSSDVEKRPAERREPEWQIFLEAGAGAVSDGSLAVVSSAPRAASA
ncbi:hypothetical protein STEG23_005718 [Scotinomys teguina]